MITHKKIIKAVLVEKIEMNVNFILVINKLNIDCWVIPTVIMSPCMYYNLKAINYKMFMPQKKKNNHLNIHIGK